MRVSYKTRLKIQTYEELQNKYFYLYYGNGCAKAAIDFINRFVITYDPRLKEKKKIPLDLYEKQEEYIKWLWNRLKSNEDGCVDKCRDVGATWVTIAFAVWLLIFHSDISIGIYTYKASELDKYGDISTLFEKARFIIKNLPYSFRCEVVWSSGYIKNNRTGSDIAGASGDHPGRGG